MDVSGFVAEMNRAEEAVRRFTDAILAAEAGMRREAGTPREAQPATGKPPELGMSEEQFLGHHATAAVPGAPGLVRARGSAALPAQPPPRPAESPAAARIREALRNHREAQAAYRAARDAWIAGGDPDDLAAMLAAVTRPGPHPSRRNPGG